MLAYKSFRSIQVLTKLRTKKAQALQIKAQGLNKECKKVTN